MGRLRSLLRSLRREAREDLDSFELLDGSTHFYDPIETAKVMFMHGYDVGLGDSEKWAEPPEIYHKICEARDPAAVLGQLTPEQPGAFVDVTRIFDTDILVNERRLELLDQTQVEDLSS